MEWLTKSTYLLAIGISRSVKPQGCLMRLLCPRESRRHSSSSRSRSGLRISPLMEDACPIMETIVGNEKPCEEEKGSTTRKQTALDVVDD